MLSRGIDAVVRTASLSKLRPQKPAERVQDDRQGDHLDLGLSESPSDAHGGRPRLEGGQQPVQGTHAGQVDSLEDPGRADGEALDLALGRRD